MKTVLKYKQKKRMFPVNPNLGNDNDIRNKGYFRVNFAFTNAYNNSAGPFYQRLLYVYHRDKNQAEEDQT